LGGELKNQSQQLTGQQPSKQPTEQTSESHENNSINSLAAAINQALLPPAVKKARLLDRSSDIPVEIHQPETAQQQSKQRTTPIPDYLDPSLFSGSSTCDHPSSTSARQLALYKNSQKPKRVRKKAAGPPQSINHKPKPIQDLINRLSSTGLKTLQPHFDGMWYVRLVGRSDWNTSTQPVCEAKKKRIKPNFTIKT
jgi:hypothetical protein